MANIYFPTKDKMIYPLRPLLSVSIIMFFASLSLAGIISISAAIYLGAIFTLDDIIFLPIMQLQKAARNLKHDRKLFKSWFTIVGVLLGAVAGAILGLLVISKLALAMTLVPLVTQALGSSLVLFILACIFGYKIINAFNKWAEHSKPKVQNPEKFAKLPWYQRYYQHVLSLLRHAGRICPDFIGIMLGAYLAEHLLPVIGGPVGLTIDVVFITLLLSAFCMALLTRWIAQSYYFVRYGHSNADGYDFAINERALSTIKKDEAIAKAIVASESDALTCTTTAIVADTTLHDTSHELRIKTWQVTRLRRLLIKIIKTIRDESLIIEDIWGIRSAKSYCYKDTLHALLTIPEASDPYVKKHLPELTQRVENFKSILNCIQLQPVPLNEKSYKLATQSKKISTPRKMAISVRNNVSSAVGLGIYVRHVGRIAQDEDETENNIRLLFHSKAQSPFYGLLTRTEQVHLEQAIAPFLSHMKPLQYVASNPVCSN